MAKPKLTPWFPPEIDPVHVGMYLRDWSDLELDAIRSRDYWDGSIWYQGAFGRPTTFKALKDRRWRGLAEQPKEQKK